MPLARFDTPGSLRDAPTGSAFYTAWHNLVTGLMTATAGTGGVGEFYNPTTKDVDLVGERALVWMGFPRRVMVQQQRDNRHEAFRLADEFTIGDRRRQEEYLEWRADKTAGKITKVTFTTEVPEYWTTLFQNEPNIVVNLYRQLTGNSSIVQADLVSGSGAYNKNNVWNTTKGMVHLTVDQLANTLGAALGLATGSASIGTGGAHYRDNYELQQGTSQAPTSADPRVTMDGNTLVRKNLSVTMRDPVGLYIAGWDDTGWTKPDGKPVGNYWRIVRGALGAALRVEYEVPASEGFVVGDIRIGGRPIEFGGQIAEHLTVTIVGIAGTPGP
jgi:hypothetical protein